MFICKYILPSERSKGRHKEEGELERYNDYYGHSLRLGGGWLSGTTATIYESGGEGLATIDGIGHAYPPPPMHDDSLHQYSHS